LTLFVCVALSLNFNALLNPCKGKEKENRCQIHSHYINQLKNTERYGLCDKNSLNTKVGDHCCTFWVNLKCAAHIAKCITPCENFANDPDGCINCMEQWWGECCCCINNDIPDVHINCTQTKFN